MPLIGTLTSGVSALRTFSKSLELIGNNIANVNTTGFKGSKASYTDSFSDTLKASSAAPGDAAVQVGTGVQLSNISTNYSQGALSTTGNATDLGISGNGFFVLQDATGNHFATRDGSFHFDTGGSLLNSEGYNVLDATGAEIVVAKYDQVKSVSIAADGTITSFDSAGAATTGQQVGLIKIAETNKLMKIGGNLYDFSNTGATIAKDLTKPATNGLGSFQVGTLEQSNVDLTEQFSDLITTQRSFQAGSRLITVSDSVLEDIVNLKR
jgi:flagellar hook protein FlgE